MKQLIATVNTLSYVSALPAIWLGRRMRGLLWYYALASFLCDAASLVIMYLGYKSRVTGNIFYLAETLLLGIYFSRLLFSGWKRTISLVVTCALALWFLIHALDSWNEKINWEYVALALILFVVFCVISLYRVLRNVEHLKIEHSPLFIFSAAVLLYSSYSLVLMLFAEYFRQAPEILRSQIWAVHNFLNVVKNLAIARVFFLQQKAARR